jgi:hypothetical protein
MDISSSESLLTIPLEPLPDSINSKKVGVTPPDLIIKKINDENN